MSDDDKTLVFEGPKAARVTRGATLPGTAYVAWITEIENPAPGAYPFAWQVFYGLEPVLRGGSPIGEARTEAEARGLAQRAVDLHLAIAKLKFDDSQKR